MGFGKLAIRARQLATTCLEAPAIGYLVDADKLIIHPIDSL